MRTWMITLLVLGITGIAWTQPQAFEPTFNSELEAKTWEAIHLADDFDPLAMFIMASPETDAQTVEQTRKRIEHAKLFFRKKYLDKHTGIKQIRQVFNQIQNRYLNEFNEDATFSQLFESGKYNCVTAVALYSMIFSDMGIQHQIKLAPTHVFLEVQIDEEEVLLETTDPLGGFIRKDAAMPDKLRQYSTKGINGTNQDGSSIYLTAKEVSLTALAGVQYYNVGVHFFEKGQYEQAISNFQKSSLLYPNFRSEEGIRTALMAQMVAQDYNETAAVENIAQLAQLAFDEHTRSFLVKGFTGFSNEKLHLQEDLEAFKQGYFTIFQRASKEETRIVLQSFYFFEVGRYYYERSEFEKSERLFKKAHELTPNIRGLSNAWLSAKQRIDSDMRVARNE